MHFFLRVTPVQPKSWSHNRYLSQRLHKSLKTMFWNQNPFLNVTYSSSSKHDCLSYPVLTFIKRFFVYFVQFFICMHVVNFRFMVKVKAKVMKCSGTFMWSSEFVYIYIYLHTSFLFQCERTKCCSDDKVLNSGIFVSLHVQFPSFTCYSRMA